MSALFVHSYTVMMQSRWQHMWKGAGLGAVVLGLIGFAGGFFGPMIFAPEANQGPLLGIFITGPLGTVAGAIIGAIAGWSRAPKS